MKGKLRERKRENKLKKHSNLRSREKTLVENDVLLLKAKNAITTEEENTHQRQNSPLPPPPQKSDENPRGREGGKGREAAKFFFRERCSELEKERRDVFF